MKNKGFTPIAIMTIVLTLVAGCSKSEPTTTPASPTATSQDQAPTPSAAVEEPVAPTSTYAADASDEPATPAPTAPQAALAPDAATGEATTGGKIVFYSDRGGESDVYIMDVADALQSTAGGEPECLTCGSGGGMAPAISPDGARIAYRAGNDIYVMNVDGSEKQRLTNTPAYESHPDWSPDGAQIAFVSERDGNREIYVMNVADALQSTAGSDVRRLTDDPADDIRPDWSPDGTQIVFNSARDSAAGDESFDIYVLDVISGGSDVRRLTDAPEWEMFPQWSPDGAQIAYTLHTPGRWNQEIYVMPAPGPQEHVGGDGERARQLTDTPAASEDPVWSPDGSQIVFQSDRDGNFELYVMNSDGSDVRRLTDDPAGDYWPSWGPSPQAPVASASEPSPAGQTLSVTIVYDNVAYDPNLRTEWGLAAWIEYGGHTLLFDTGGDGPTLLGNLQKLGLDPRQIESVVLSHAHGDHVGGLQGLLDTGIKPTVYALASFPGSFKQEARSQVELVEVRDELEIWPGLHTTGEVQGPVIEQALVLETSEGLVVITGCAHPGIVRIVRKAREIVDDDVVLVLGGFHLLETSESGVQGIINDLRQLGVRRASPTHCTGESAIAAFAAAFSEDYAPGGAGRVFVVGGGPGAATDQASVAAVVAQLQGLPLDDFFERSYEQLLLRSPETLTRLGLSESFGLRNDRLDDLSEVYLRETQELQSAILDLLRGYEREELTPAQQLSYDVYEWYLDDLLRGHEFAYHNYPVHQFLVGYQDNLVDLFTDLQPLDDKRDAKDYVSRLAQVDEQMQQMLAGLELREQMGVIPPRFIVRFTLESIARHLGSRVADPVARQLAVYTVFEEKLARIDDLDAGERQALLDAALAQVQGAFIPAYQELYAYFEHLETVATDDAGVWKLPDGEAYYAYLLRHETSTDLSPEQIHALGLAEVERIQAEMRSIFDELGYPPDASLGELMSRAVQEGGGYDTSTQAGKDQVVQAYEDLIQEVEQRLDEFFDLRPQGGVQVIAEYSYGGGGGYYQHGALDGSRPGAFHTGLGGSWVNKYRMPVTAYHEAVPGHHLQVALALELDLPTFRKILKFNAHVEGWGMYAEQLTKEMGLFDDDPCARLGQLHLELLRAVRLVADTGLHSLRWSRSEAKAYMNEALGDPSGGYASEVDRYVVIPAQAVSYKVGMLKILELRQRAMDQLGERFDIKTFHNVVLGNGSVPLAILERLVDDWVAETLNQ